MSRWGRRKPGERREPRSRAKTHRSEDRGLLEQLPPEATAGLSIDAFITDAFVGWSPWDAAWLRELIAQSRRFG